MADNKSQLVIPNYPSNSSLDPHHKDDKDNIRVVEKVISGTATVRKKNVWGRLIESFLIDDLPTVLSTMYYDMVIPGIKEGILGGMEMLFFGSTRGRRTVQSTARRNVDRASYMINYGSYSNGSRKAKSQEADLDSRYAASMDDITFDDRAEAELVLDALREDIRKYNEATLSAYYQYAGISSNDYTASDRGWTNLDMAIRPRRIRGGRYVLDLPRPQQLV